jgi:hypothetical protein
MITLGLKFILVSLPALLGVLHALRTRLAAQYHLVLWAAPLTAPRSRWQRRHLRKPCAECSMISEMVTTRLVR